MPASRRPAFLVFIAVVVLGLAWSVYTNHVWEDYYITFRASRNLATGHGLVFTPGERVHTFTSPLGVLLPAAASLAVGNRSDAAALFVFRLVSIGALAGAAVFLFGLARRAAGTWVGVLLALMVCAESKAIDYAINGMETGILLFFLAWAFWALVTAPARSAVHLGCAFAGLMWSRPDSWVYIGALASAAVLLPEADGSRTTLRARSGLVLRAGALMTVIYAPWVLWAWWYYGTPVPHTIIAKGLEGDHSLAGLALGAVGYLGKIFAGKALLGATFLPPYGLMAGWPGWVAKLSYGLAAVAAFLWLVPGVGREARIASWAALAGQMFLGAAVKAPVPWYLPTIATLSLVALVLGGARLVAGAGERGGTGVANRAVIGRLAVGFAAVWALGAVLLSAATAHQMRWQQRLIEDGNRTAIGLWLKRNAGPKDTVFLECLGYIGYFSGLKMLDFPGLASPEVVAARRRIVHRGYPEAWPELIDELHPDWLVLRPHEIEVLQRRAPEILRDRYEPVRRFDVADQINAVTFLPGRNYLWIDYRFDLYRRKP